jgi:hypothetical protein
MNIENYDFESALEQGFKGLFDSAGLALSVPDDIDLELGDESVMMQIDTGGPGSNEHLNGAGEYDTYTGAIQIEVRTIRPSIDAPTNPLFKSRHNELVATIRKTMEEIGSAELAANWPDALSPIKIKPSNTQREIDDRYKISMLSYELQFRIT